VYAILSIDGGGIRGILPGQMLVALEDRLQKRSGNPDARIADYFDLMAGTSTGGILVSLLLCPGENGRPRFTAKEAVDLYLLHGSKIFVRPFIENLTNPWGMNDPKYPAKHIEALLKEYFGNTKLSELLRPCIITSYNIETRAPHFFTQHDARSREGYDFPLRDVARATSAAPTYFEPALAKSTTGVSYPLVDGGVFANNPALCAYAEARQIFASMQKTGKTAVASDMLMVSMGTGTIEKPYKYDAAKEWGMISWVQPILDIMMSASAETIDFQIDKMFDAAGVRGQYFRLMPDLDRASEEMDLVDEENLELLRQAGIHAAEINGVKLDTIAEKLITLPTVK
jgi:uncharacterized protein